MISSELHEELKHDADRGMTGCAQGRTESAVIFARRKPRLKRVVCTQRTMIVAATMKHDMRVEAAVSNHGGLRQHSVPG